MAETKTKTEETGNPQNNIDLNLKTPETDIEHENKNENKNENENEITTTNGQNNDIEMNDKSQQNEQTDNKENDKSHKHHKRHHHDHDRHRSSRRRDRDRDRYRSNSRERDRDRSRSGSHGRSSRHRSRHSRSSRHDRHRSPSYDRHRSSRRDRDRDRRRDRDRDRDRSRHSRSSRSSRHRSHDRDRRDRDRDRDRHRDRSRDRSHRKSPSPKQTSKDSKNNNDNPTAMEQDNIASNYNALQSHIKISSGNNHGPSMLIPVTVYPKSTPGESKQIQLNISKTSTVSGFKGNLCAQGFNVFLQYDLFVGGKKLDVEDDRLLCVHVGIKADQSANKIVVKPKADNDPSKKPINDQYDPFMASSNGGNTTNTHQISHNHNNNNNSNHNNHNNISKPKVNADQIEMYKAYEEMFGVEEAAGMMGLDPAEIKKHGIEKIIKTLEEEKLRKQQDEEAAEAARSTTTSIANARTRRNDGGVGVMMSAQNYYSEEMLYAQALQAAAFTTGNPALAASGATGLPINPTVAAAQLQGNTYNGIPTNENLIDFDTAPGTTHTAGGGTVSRPPPAHVSENACIFVGDLHPMVTRSDLLSVFSQIGSVQWIQLFDCHKQMNRPFNFAFVYFEDILVARNAITTLNYTKFYGSPCRLMWKQEKNSVQWTDCNIIVKNLPPNTDSQLLHAVFSKFGKILSSKVKTTATGRTLPYGYVQYATKDGADKAIIASDKGQLSVNGHLLTAEWFKSREDRAFRQIYVKNIPSSWSDEDLLQLFEAQTLGKIKSFTVKHSPYGRWACISFHEPHHAVKAIEKLNNCPTGDPQSPTLSVSRFMYKTERDKFKTIKKGDVEQCYSIYVGNVPLQLTDQHMRQLFEPFGAVISAAVVQKTEDYKYGFVNFEQPEDAARALVTMNGKSIGGKTLQVKPANTDMSKAIAITQAADYVSTNSHHTHTQQPQQPKQPMTNQQAKAILADGKKEKVWKVQYGEDWHEYDQLLAAIVEQLTIGEQIQITLADSNYIITRIQETEAMQKNCASGTMRKVVRSTRDI